MTEISDRMKPLPAAVERFVLHWGDMGGQWGVNRSVSQIHALLYVSPRPLTADDIAGALGLARSNVSASIKELIAWSLIRRVPVKGDRRDHFESVKDVWEIFRIVSEERKRREIDPTLRVLRECVEELRGAGDSDKYTRERLESMLEFLMVMTGLFEEVVRMPASALKDVAKLRGKVITLLGATRQKAAG